MRLIVYRAPSYKSLALGTTRRICFTTRLADEGKQGTANEQAAQAEREEAERAIYNSKQMRHFQAAMSNPVIKPYHQKRTPRSKQKPRTRAVGSAVGNIPISRGLRRKIMYSLYLSL